MYQLRKVLEMLMRKDAAALTWPGRIASMRQQQRSLAALAAPQHAEMTVPAASMTTRLPVTPRCLDLFMTFHQKATSLRPHEKGHAPSQM